LAVFSSAGVAALEAVVCGSDFGGVCSAEACGADACDAAVCCGSAWCGAATALVAAEVVPTIRGTGSNGAVVADIVVADILRSSRVFLSFSQREGFGLPPLEALACGCAVVGYHGFGGRALFVVGMHPASSRLARRFRWPALVFNPRAQFERLRAEGKFERLRTLVRERDVALQGTPNPTLADFGERSEARQYSGRETEPEWRCPFHRKNE